MTTSVNSETLRTFYMRFYEVNYLIPIFAPTLTTQNFQFLTFTKRPASLLQDPCQICIGNNRLSFTFVDVVILVFF